MVLHLVAGHDNVRDPGAVSRHSILGEIKESDLNIEFRDLLSLELDKLGIKHTKDDDTHNLRQVINNLNSIVNTNDLLIDIHFNAGPSTATGTEVFIKTTPHAFEREVATEIVNVCSTTLEIRNRGVRTEALSNRGRIGILHVPCYTLLIEICFISNENDINQYTKWKFILASRIADILNKAVNK